MDVVSFGKTEANSYFGTALLEVGRDMSSVDLVGLDVVLGILIKDSDEAADAVSCEYVSV